MDVIESIRAERSKGRVFCGVAKADSASALAAAFGLSAEPGRYRETDDAMARAILVGVLHRDLAYGTRIMPLARAEELASDFMRRFDHPHRKFFTNGEFKVDAGAGLVLSHWDPATSATFDTGILVIAPGESACVWVADED